MQNNTKNKQKIKIRRAEVHSSNRVNLFTITVIKEKNNYKILKAGKLLQKNQHAADWEWVNSRQLARELVGSNLIVA